MLRMQLYAVGRQLPTRRYALSQATRAASSTTRTMPEIKRRPGPSQQQRIQQLQEIIVEATQLYLKSGRSSVIRTVQASQALASLAAEQLQSGTVDKPQVIVRKLFEKLGATYIKIGQFIASSPSLFPEEYVVEFQTCLDQTSPVDFQLIKATVRRSLGKAPEEVFAYIDPKPLASASIAQVHRAVLRGSNKEVVIKVLKPGVEDILTADLDFIYVASRFLEWINPDLGRTSLSAIVGDIRTSMMDEVDFVKEAMHIQHFRGYLEATGMDQFATCPYVYREQSSRSVLTMEYLEGVALTDIQAIQSITTADPEQVLIGALNTWFGSVLASETFHADVHGGNLIVLKDGRVGFIDFGIVGRISKVTWLAIQKFFQAVGTNDYTTMAQALATMGATDLDIDIEAFAKDLRDVSVTFQTMETRGTLLVDSVTGEIRGQAEIDNDEINRLLIKIIQVSESYGVKIPREFGLLIKQLLYFDRYVRILAPRLSILNDERIQYL